MRLAEVPRDDVAPTRPRRSPPARRKSHRRRRTVKNHLAATSARSISAVMMMVLGLGACASPKNEEDAIEQRQSALTYPLPNATGDPQFFGFGYPQLAIMDGTNLQVLASPVR